MEEKTPPAQFHVGDFFSEAITLLLKYRKFLSRFVLSITVASILLALVLPKWYLATVSVFPAEQEKLPTGIGELGLLSGAFSASKALSSLSGNPDLDRYSVILKSSSVLSAVIQKFDLAHVYGITSDIGEKTAKELLSNTDFTIEPEGNLTVSVYDKSPQRAADMANYFVEQLNHVNSDLMSQNARGNREFIEQRYEKNLSDLAAAEDSLKEFQKRSGILALPEQVEASIKAVTELAGQAALEDVQSAILARTLSEDHPSVKQARIEVEELHRKLEEMKNGSNYRAGDMRIIMPFNKLPDMGAEYVRRYRDVQIQNKILEFLTPIYEQAKVEEKRETPSVVVLDKAAPPERKAKPKITIYALLGFVLSILIGLFIVFLREAISKLKAQHPENFVALKDAIVNDWFGLRSKPRRSE
ncbi:MAG TPA: GNVR domain-containing protein [Bacteroidota bacterium]|nr:GNVR domain-containing protein [Bacteroidota bacterium]